MTSAFIMSGSPSMGTYFYRIRRAKLGECYRSEKMTRQRDGIKIINSCGLLKEVVISHSHCV